MKMVTLKNTDSINEKRITVSKGSADTQLEIHASSLEFSLSEDGSSLDFCLAPLQSEPIELEPFDNAILHYWWDEKDGRDLDTNTGIIVPDRRHISVGYGGYNYNKAGQDGDYLVWGGDNRPSGRLIHLRLCPFFGILSFDMRAGHPL